MHTAQSRKSPIIRLSAEPIQMETTESVSSKGNLRYFKTLLQTGGSTDPEHDKLAFQINELAFSPEERDNWMFFRSIFSQGNSSLQANLIAILLADVPFIFLNETSSIFVADVCIPKNGSGIK